MSIIQRFLDRIRRKRKPIEIPTKWGPVSERARGQAAENLRRDPARRAEVLRIVVREMGGDEEKGLAEARRRFPESGF